MDTITFGKTGLPVSRLGFGAAPTAFLDEELDQLRSIIDYLASQGVNLIDTAAAYPGSEKALGPILRGRRDDFVLVSKCGQAFDDLPGEAWSPTVIAATVDRSLRLLETDHLDVMLLHSCKKEVLEKSDALAELVRARDAGKVRFVGYSGDNEAAAYAAGLDEISVIETSISIADQANIDAVLPTCVKRDLGVIAKRPIANAAWKHRSQQRGMYQDYASDYCDRLAAMEVSPLDLGYSGHTEVEWPEIALKFTLAQPGVHTAIVGTTSPTNAQINVQAVEKNPLRDQAVQKLRDAFKTAQKHSGDPWPGLT